MAIWYRRRGKWAFDLAVSVSGVLALLLLAVSVGILVRIRLGSPVVFQQVRYFPCARRVV
jgi:lipopolysaccharide/colanic/teichoic acid biosynthesis glycosyltransferase